jgi:lipoprotein signal peptidase
MAEEICNTGSAWGILENQHIIKFGSTVLLLIILYLVYNAKTKMKRFGWILIFVGGSVNTWERFRNGCVTDYLKPFDWYPAFNLADIIIVLGIIVLAYSICHSDRSPV